MACVVPIDDDELNAGRAWVCTAEAEPPIGEVIPDGCMKPLPTRAGGKVAPPFQDAPTLAGGKNSMLATCTLWGAPRVGGMG
ncbi:hypothetical protein [Devosia sp. CAU 1758]